VEKWVNFGGGDFWAMCVMALNGLFCADVPLKNYSLTLANVPKFQNVYPAFGFKANL